MVCNIQVNAPRDSGAFKYNNAMNIQIQLTDEQYAFVEMASKNYPLYHIICDQMPCTIEQWIVSLIEQDRRLYETMCAMQKA